MDLLSKRSRAAYGPLGFIGDTRIQRRVALHRSNSIVFQNTFAGVGGRFRASPAFADGRLYLSISSIDIFDMDVNVDLTGTWPGFSGQLLYDRLGDKKEKSRRARTDNQQPGMRLTVGATPTFKLKVGPIIALDSIEIAYLHHFVPATLAEPYIYEATRDMLLEPQDIVITQFGALLYEVMGNGSFPLLRAGAAVRDRNALNSGDGHTAAGGMLMYRHADKPAGTTWSRQAAPGPKTP